MEIVLAVLTTLELVEDTVRKRAEALSASEKIVFTRFVLSSSLLLHKAILMPDLATAVHDLLLDLERFRASKALHIVEETCAAAILRHGQRE